MKTRFQKLLAASAAVVWLSTFNYQLSTSFAQGTAFTYQGQLQNGGALASGTYNLTFALVTNNAGGTAVAGPVTNNGVGVSNGLFTVVIDFGAGPWTGVSNWLEIAVETNGAGSFTTLAPRQEVTPTPYAIFANTASNLSGTVQATQISGAIIDTQLLHDALNVNPGPGLSGGGRVLLGNTIILTNTGVLSVTGNADVTATTVSGAVTLGDTATNTDTPNTIVKRDGTGSFSADNVTVDGVLNLPAASTSVVVNSGGTLLMSVDTNTDLFLGLNAGPGLSGAGNTGVGYNALNDAIGSFNTAFGDQALFLNNGGSNNTAVGYKALFSNTLGSNNTASGYEALYSNTLGFFNTADGFQALYSNIGNALDDGSANTATGCQALYSNTFGFDNTADGYQALFSNTTGSDNTASGVWALYSHTNGFGNTANGIEALYHSTSGSENIGLGYEAGFNITNGSFNIEIGNNGNATDFATIRIGTSGTQTNTFIAGISGVTISPAGAAVFVNSAGELGTVNSSRRYKEDIQDMGDQSDVLLSLRPVAFRYKHELDPLGTPQFGLIAEEVEKVAPELVLRDDGGKIYSVRYEQINAMLLNEFLKQHSEFQKEHQRVEDQGAEIEQLKEQLNKLQQLITAKK